MIDRIVRTEGTFVLAFGLSLLLIAGCGGGGEQAEQAPGELNTTIDARTRDDIPDTGITSNLAPGSAVMKDALPQITIADGVTARVAWGKGVMMAWLTLAPGARIPEETLASERLMVVCKGSLVPRQVLADLHHQTLRVHEPAPQPGLFLRNALLLHCRHDQIGDTDPRLTGAEKDDLLIDQRLPCNA